MSRVLEVVHRGCSLHARIEGSGPPVLWIQGTGIGAKGWRPQIDAMPDVTSISFDNRGFGRSQPVAEKVTVELMAADALAVLDAAGVERAHVVGHSLGGLIALELALQASRRVTSLSLLCTFADGGIPTGLSMKMLWIGSRTRIGTRSMRRRAFLELVLAPDERRGDLEELADRLAELFEHDLADSPPIVMSQFGAMRASNVVDRLPGLAGIPTLVVSAEHDPIAPPRAGRQIAAGIPGAEYVEIAGASHGVPIQQAERINNLLRTRFGG